jgi:hypothetical protein
MSELDIAATEKFAERCFEMDPPHGSCGEQIVAVLAEVARLRAKEQAVHVDDSTCDHLARAERAEAALRGVLAGVSTERSPEFVMALLGQAVALVREYRDVLDEGEDDPTIDRVQGWLDGVACSISLPE